jgi:hypothetical protein
MNNTDRLKPILANLDRKHYAELRDAYYKAAEGLASLESLIAEAADQHRGLAGEMKHVRNARQQFDRCGLGKVL